MTNNLNKVHIQGNLTRDPEVRFTQAGMAIAKFGVAVNSGFGEKQTVAFIDCVAFDKRAETIGKLLTKGQQVIITGRLHQDSWENEGKRHTKIVVYVDDFHFVASGKRKESGTEDAPVAATEAVAATDEKPPLF